MMGIGDWAKKKSKQFLDTQVQNAKDKRDFEKNVQDLSIPFDRQINLNPSGKELEWLEAVLLYEEDYFTLRVKLGWKLVKGWEFRRSTDRFAPVRWEIGDKIVEARYERTGGLHVGIVSEKVIK